MSCPDFSSQWLASPQSATLTATPGPDTSRALPPQPPQPLSLIQQRFQTLLEGARESWSYAIFWESSHIYSGALGWGDGYYKGDDDQKAPKTTSSSSAEQAFRKKVLCELEYLVSGRSTSAADLDPVVTDTEWFFLISMPQSFVNGSGLPGQAFFNSSPVWVVGPDLLSESACERARAAQAFGLQTLVCIPCANGVVELASTEVILPNPDLMNKVRVWFNFNNPHASTEIIPYSPEGTPRLPVHEPPAIKLLGKYISLRETEDNEAQNCGNNFLSNKQSRGKEKMSNSKCSWSLLSESSDGDTESTFSHPDVYSGPS